MPSIAPPFMREDAMSRMCNRSNLVVVRTLGAGAQGSVSLLRTADGIEVACKTFKARTADEHKLFLAGGITSRVEAEVRIQQLLAASNLTSQRVAPRVLASCVGAGRPFILSEAGSGGWLSRTSRRHTVRRIRSTRSIALCPMAMLHTARTSAGC